MASRESTQTCAQSSARTVVIPVVETGKKVTTRQRVRRPATRQLDSSPIIYVQDGQR